LRNLRYFSTEEIRKADFLKAVIIINEAFVRMARRYADLAAKMAAHETDLRQRN
jgi:hypothetical protein